MSVPPAPERLDGLQTEPLAAGTRLHRVHGVDYAGNAFNPCKGDPTRFAPIRTDDGACIPSLYAAASFDAACYKTVFHDIAMTTPFKTIRIGALEHRAHAALVTRRELKIIKLFRPDLGRHPYDIVRADAKVYTETARWAETCHRSRADAHGLVWTSNRCDPDRCYLFFGDRVGADAFDIAERRFWSRSPALRDDIRKAGLRAGIEITR